MAGLLNAHFISMRAVGQLAPRIHINWSRFLTLLIKPSHFSLQYISRSQYVRYSCEQGWEGDRGRGNKGLMSLARRGWRLRQMAWSLQHSGVDCMVLKSSSLTFQQILPGGWGVCHTTPRIHTAPPPPIHTHPSGLWPLYSTFLLFCPHICIDSHINMYRYGPFGPL